MRRMPRKPMGSSSAHAAARAMEMHELRKRFVAAGQRLMFKNVRHLVQLISEEGKGADMEMKRIVDKCNYGLEGPSANETFLPVPPLREDDAKVVADILNRAEGPNSHRFWAVVDLDYELFKFEV